jgi:uncharacterized protein (DUF4415 family)
MKVKDTKKTSNTDWERLSTMDDSEINLEDISELNDSFFANATIRLPKPKKSVSLRLDPDVLEWYKHQGPGYQTRMNAVLRMYMRAKNSNVKSSPTMKKTVKRQLTNKKVN